MLLLDSESDLNTPVTVTVKKSCVPGGGGCHGSTGPGGPFFFLTLGGQKSHGHGDHVRTTNLSQHKLRAAPICGP